MHKMFLSQQQKEMTMKLKRIAHSQEKTILKAIYHEEACTLGLLKTLNQLF